MQELAAIFAMTGRPEEAIEQLDTLLSIPSDVSPALLRIDPIWDSLRDEQLHSPSLQPFGHCMCQMYMTGALLSPYGQREWAVRSIRVYRVCPVEIR